MKKRNATIKDIAKELNIAPSTVSRALKGYLEISEETKAAVKEVAERLNYQPNSFALSLRYNRSHAIGVIIPEIVHFFFSTVISGIEDIAQSRGYNIIVTQTNDSLDREIANLQTLYNGRVDGILMSISKETTSGEHIEALVKKGVPITFFDRALEGLNLSKVLIDDFQAGYQATKHLIEQGYSRIAHLAGPLNLNMAVQRLEGYKKAMNEADLFEEEYIIIRDMASGESDAFEATKMIIENDLADAVFAINDMSAIGAIKAARSLNVKVPEEFGVMGFSNWRFTSLTNPTVSTIEQPGFEMGQHAAELLIDEIEAEDDTEHEAKTIILDTSVVARESSLKNGNPEETQE